MSLLNQLSIAAIVYRALYEGVFDYPKTMVDKMINYIREDNDKHAKSTINQWVVRLIDQEG